MSSQIINIIDDVFDGKDQYRNWEETKGIMLHRAGVNLVDDKVIGYDGLTVARAFTGRIPEWEAVAKATNRQNAYSLMIGTDCHPDNPEDYDGKVWQALPLDEIGWHGRQFSRGWIGICWLGDPRVRPLSPNAMTAALDLCAQLCTARGWNPYRCIKGHGEVPRAHSGEKSPGKREACPGLSQSSLNAFRDDVETLMREGGLRSLHDSGLVFEK